jgi:hypothetical protein
MADTSFASGTGGPASFHNNGRVSAGIVQQGAGHAARDLYNGKFSVFVLHTPPMTS